MITVASDSIDMMKASLVEMDIPRRGGKEWLCVFIGGALLDPNYEQDHDTEISYYQNAHQIRG